MRKPFTSEIRKNLLERVEKFKDSFIEERAFDLDEGVLTEFKFLQYGINDGNLSIISAVCDLTYNDSVYNFVSDILEELVAKG
ncbi:hypothetical protein ACFUP3_20940 [Bacillus paralicheniformis]|uniref:hypothetical protein n=1 Tax=Bacillus paralicheniformis TaxID=1648923 RepID=UPI00363EA429